jgi:hypothetical protein
MGDRFFDLANFSINHEPTRPVRRFSTRTSASSAKTSTLQLMRFMSDFREAMWGVVQTAVSELDFDFGAYATEHFERLERTAASSEFRAALAA